MMTKNNKDNAQLTISHELLLLLRWLASHEEERLKKMVQKALRTGLHKEIQEIDAQPYDIEELEYSMSDFLTLMEMLLQNEVNDHIDNDVKERNLNPTIDKIDSIVCGTETLRSSIEKTASKTAKNPAANAQDVLFQELLKNWKPSTKIIN